jgi:hypothetical protein
MKFGSDTVFYTCYINKGSRKEQKGLPLSNSLTCVYAIAAFHVFFINEKGMQCIHESFLSVMLTKRRQRTCRLEMINDCFHYT